MNQVTREQKDLAMFGCNRKTLRGYFTIFIDDSAFLSIPRLLDRQIGILSNVQEMILRDDHEAARRALNTAKFMASIIRQVQDGEYKTIEAAVTAELS